MPGQPTSDSPEVSVVMPCLNEAETLAVCIQKARACLADSGVSGEGKAAIRRWRSDRALGTVEMDEVAVALNEALGTVIDEKTTRVIRRRGRYISTKELGGMRREA